MPTLVISELFASHSGLHGKFRNKVTTFSVSRGPFSGKGTTILASPTHPQPQQQGACYRSRNGRPGIFADQQIVSSRNRRLCCLTAIFALHERCWYGVWYVGTCRRATRIRQLTLHPRYMYQLCTHEGARELIGSTPLHLVLTSIKIGKMRNY